MVVRIGDFADMPSLSSYDQRQEVVEGRRYTNDIDASRQAMDALLQPLQEFNQNAAKNHKQRYKPRLVLTLGNHEDRINRAINNDAKLEGLISTNDL